MTGHQPSHPLPFFFHCFKNQQIFLDIISCDKIPVHIRVADGIKQMICNAGGENPVSSHQPVVWVTVWSPPVQRSLLSNMLTVQTLYFCFGGNIMCSHSALFCIGSSTSLRGSWPSPSTTLTPCHIEAGDRRGFILIDLFAGFVVSRLFVFAFVLHICPKGNLKKTRPGVQQCQAQGLVFCPWLGLI